MPLSTSGVAALLAARAKVDAAVLASKRWPHREARAAIAKAIRVAVAEFKRVAAAEPDEAARLEIEKLIVGLQKNEEIASGYSATEQRLRSTSQEPFKAPPRPPRNSPCFCGSGKKYKKCCGARVD